MGERYQHEVDSVYTEFVEQKLIDGIREAGKNWHLHDLAWAGASPRQILTGGQGY